jgi:hypothetical protein
VRVRCLSFCYFVCYLFGAPSILLGQAWAEGKGKLATCRHRADSGGETVKNVRRHSLDRLHASMNKQKKKTDIGERVHPPRKRKGSERSSFNRLPCASPEASPGFRPAVRLFFGVQSSDGEVTRSSALRYSLSEVRTKSECCGLLDCRVCFPLSAPSSRQRLVVWKPQLRTLITLPILASLLPSKRHSDSTLVFLPDAVPKAMK